MAEYAQRSIEEMLIEVEKMRKINLFTSEETRAIMKKGNASNTKCKEELKKKKFIYNTFNMR